MDDDLARRLKDLESRSTSTTGMAPDFRVIEMQLARAEDKILRLGRASSWTQPGFEVSETRDLL